MSVAPDILIEVERVRKEASRGIITECAGSRRTSSKVSACSTSRIVYSYK